MGRGQWVLLGAGLAFLTWLTWAEVVKYFFPSEDALGFIPFWKLDRFSDLANVLFREAGQDKFQGVIASFRPLTCLTFSLDYALYGLNPVGYHITDLLLHGLSALVLFVLVLNLPNADRKVACFGACLFLVHPLHIETVPVSIRRSEILLGLFTGLALIYFLRYLRERRTASGDRFFLSLGASLLFAGLAFCSKETAVTLPALIFLFAFFFAGNGNRGFVARLWDSLVRMFPYVFVGILFFALRWKIIGGLGGYSAGSELLLFNRLVLSAAIVVYSSIRLLIPFLPLTPSPIEYVTMYPVFFACGFVVLMALIVFLGIKRRIPIRQAFPRPATNWVDGNVGVYVAMLLCILALLSPYALLGNVSPWYAYVPVMFVSILCAMGLRDALRYLGEKPWRQHGYHLDVCCVSILCLAVIAYVSLLTAFSPLFTRSYRDWETASQIGKEALEKTEALIANSPSGSRFYLLNYPIILANHIFDWNHVRSLAILYDYTVEGYFRLKYPEKAFQFIGLSFTSLADLPDRLDVRTVFDEFPVIRVRVFNGGILTLPRFHVDVRSRERATGQWFDAEVEKENTSIPRVFMPFTEIRVEMKPAGLEAENIYFLLYEGTSISLYDPVDHRWEKESVSET